MALRKSFPYHKNISLVISSPFRRTLYTAIHAFESSLTNGHCQPRIIALPEIQEASNLPCDRGSDVDKLRDEMEKNRVPVDLSLVEEGWNVKTADSKWAPSSEALSRRAREARRYVRDQMVELLKRGEKDPEVVVVSHGGFLHYLTEDWEDNTTFHGEFFDVDYLYLLSLSYSSSKSLFFLPCLKMTYLLCRCML